MSFLQHVFSGLTGDFKGAFTTSKTVSLEKMKDNPDQEILRFGPKETDYFPVEGNSFQKAALREILSKVLESDSMLKKIRALPVEDRPTLCMENSMTCGGWCNGDRICMCYQSGTGYSAAGIFAHEFQHQYQYKKGDGLPPRVELSSQEQMINDRIYESAADTAKYQYMYEMRDKNPQARKAYAESRLSSPGLRAYAKAKKAGKPEDEAVLAGMKGYASSFSTAKFYVNDYHPELKHTDRKFKIDKNISERKKENYLTRIEFTLTGKEKADFTTMLKDHTVGMTPEPISSAKARRLVRNPDYCYITSGSARALRNLQKKYKELTGEEHPSVKNDFWVRNSYGVFTEKGKEGLPGLMHKAGNAIRNIKNLLKPKRDDRPTLMDSLRDTDKASGKVSMMQKLSRMTQKPAVGRPPRTGMEH